MNYNYDHFIIVIIAVTLNAFQIKGFTYLKMPLSLLMLYCFQV